MFDSGITAADLIAEIESEADIAPDIEKNSYIQWLNSVEQLLYSEIIKEQKKHKLDLTRFLIDLTSTHPGLKLNLWPLFESQQIGDCVLDVSEDGTYTIRIDSASGTTASPVTFTKKITLRQGTYTLSDNAQEYTGGMPATLKRIYITNASTGAVLAGLAFQATPNACATFELEEDTEVVLHIRVLEYHDYGVTGCPMWPQLELGSAKTSEFIKPARAALTEDIPVILCSLPTNQSEAPVRFEDIHAVYADDVQMIKSTLSSGTIFYDAYFKEENKLGLHFSKIPNNLSLVYTVRPVLKTVGNISTERVKVPAEFIDLVKAKLRGEAYKLANEDALAAKWLNDYNILLDTFREWVLSRSPSFGL